jgi:hypothetical protein
MNDDEKELEKFYNWLLEKGYSETTVRTYWYFMKRLYYRFGHLNITEHEIREAYKNYYFHIRKNLMTSFYRWKEFLAERDRHGLEK